MKRNKTYISGCLIGGAIGDAFGAPLKFMKYDSIVHSYGVSGVVGLADLAGNGQMEITDDTQMMLFTGEGIIRSFVRCKQKHIERNVKDTIMVVFRSYIRWLYTQGLKMPNWPVESYDGWLVKIKPLYIYRNPGITCITALGKGIMGKIEKPINASKRCGAVVRVAPVGLVEDEAHVFEVGSKTGAITHGDPTAYLAAGTLATIIFYIIEGNTIEEATTLAIKALSVQPDSEACCLLLEKALTYGKHAPSVEHLHEFGEGFMAHEALAMGVYTALCHQEDFEAGILFAINQSGNSNSIAVIAGNLLGAYLGIEKINETLIKRLELSDVIIQMAEDLCKTYDETDEWLNKYPGW